MDRVKPLVVALLILAFFLGIGIGHHIPARNDPYAAPEPCPTEISSLDALAVALRDPKIAEWLDQKEIRSIGFSKNSYPERRTNYTQIEFHLQDPDPDDHMTAPRIMVQINDSCMVSSAYQPYPAYIPDTVSKT